MCNISVKTKEEFFFGGAKTGKIKMCIEKIVNVPKEERYYLTIVDRCVKEREALYPQTDETDAVVGTQTILEEEVLVAIERDLSFSYQELNALSQLLKLDKSKFKNETDYINEMFRQGLYAVTTQECQNGLLGEAGKGRYQTTAIDWEIVR